MASLWLLQGYVGARPDEAEAATRSGLAVPRDRIPSVSRHLLVILSKVSSGALVACLSA